MNENKKKSAFDGGIIAAETPRRYTVPEHVKSLNGKRVDETVNGFEDFGVYEDDDIMEEVVEMPASLLKAPEDMPEAPENLKKSRAGRKPRKSREAVHTSLEMVGKKKVLHEAEVLEITYRSLDKSLLMDLLVKQYLTALEIHEDSAPTILNHLWGQARLVDGKRMYTSSLQATAQALELSYASIQKVTKKMISKKLLSKEADGFLAFDSLLLHFFESLTVNKQVVLTFEELEEEQMEAITKDSKINEEMTS
ncbi:hypothetical protein [Streptococcus mitis]|uniref:Uncharacterized protein n=1 Tax=Streptococcus mitis TaxID=28037 RepID=A0A139PKC3_STRMT|nr:hypothetical protein [Streptococcus mitis]KXT90676.1 hypothetical protein SMIDD26_01980 [Streptococcus mitis]